ncbi:ABC transporter ATP-binding protein [Azospirillum griseum]|uniref:sn-glycerol-3-phosphate ABC transporter ATP-binding protein UgpC n=1 Tax=Azospirillum griseum TaxID=2496639 RepID=A0A431VIR4_9PROT|nr:sn-glycerol-3-phosphate ABC transporter ATP-binding protein UgpC [Azospirillum griseum]RTR20992.1 sn-glycerol-3-phosphate ABC transporter ATP-binding protein UgpC [Azospirillum griseum]
MAPVSLRQIRKSYHELSVIHGIDLEIADGEFIVFVGPSGCGKSTLLRMIAGLEEITGGDLTIDGVRANDQSPVERGVAMVFQSYALYPHMTVRDNMAFGLKMAKADRTLIAQRVAEAARILHLERYLDRRPSALSGGQRQRVAIGRAIVRHPKVFLFDEPLSNLDAALRVNTRLEIARLHRDLGNTMIYVTHDQVEAMTLADRIVVLNGGRVEQVGTPAELYERPANRFVASFIGSPAMSFLPAQIAALDGGRLTLALADGRPIPTHHRASEATRLGDPVTIGLRPEHLAPDGPGSAALPVEIQDIEYHGDRRFLYASAPGANGLTMAIPGGRPFQVGDRFDARFDPTALHVFDGAGVALPV